MFMCLQTVVKNLYDKSLLDQPLSSRNQDPDNTQYNHYRCVDRQSHNVLVCIGDSWTKGHGLDNQDDCFGSLLSKDLNYDWLNCGGAGYSNSWILSNFDFLVDWLNSSCYVSGAVVLTFTENGRDIQDYSSRKFDYLSAYTAKTKTKEFYDDVLNDIEKEWCLKLQSIADKLDSRFQLIVGTNFASHSDFKQFCHAHPGITYIEPRWIDLLDNGVPCPQIRIASTLGIEALNSILKIEHNTEYKKWFLEFAENKTALMSWMKNNKRFFDLGDEAHPNAQGHCIWADAVKEVLTFDLGVANPSVRPAAGHAP